MWLLINKMLCLGSVSIDHIDKSPSAVSLVVVVVVVGLVFRFIGILVSFWFRALHRRLIHETKLPQPYRMLSLLALLAFSLSSFLGPITSKLLGSANGSWLGTIMLICCGANAFLLPLVLAFDMFGAVRRRFGSHQSSKGVRMRCDAMH
jgi:hypothetical protein